MSVAHTRATPPKCLPQSLDRIRDISNGNPPLKWATSLHGQIQVTTPPLNTAISMTVSTNSPKHQEITPTTPTGPNAVTGSNWKRSYKQTYEYDAFFNMSRKTSSDRRSPMSTSFSSLLNYELAYEYSPEKPHQAARIGERYYGYDTNGNLIEESSAPIGQSETGEAPREQRIGDVRRVDQGWGYEFDNRQKRERLPEILQVGTRRTALPR